MHTNRFHVLSEFDQGKRSCRKRLAEHNRRRRKSQDLSTASAAVIINSQKDNNNNNLPYSEKPLITVTKPLETCSSVTHVSSPPQPPVQLVDTPAPPMGLELGCGVIEASAGLSASSSTGMTTSPPQSLSFLLQLWEFRGHEHGRFPSWDEAEDGNSIRGMYQSN